MNLKPVLSFLILACLLPTSVSASPQIDIHTAMETTSFGQARKLLFGDQPVSNRESVDIIIRTQLAKGIWGGNSLPITILSENEQIESIAILAREDKKYPRPHGMIPGSPIRPVLAYYRLSKHAWPFLKTSIRLSTPSTVYVFVKTNRGLYLEKQHVTFYYRTAGGWEAHGQIVKRCTDTKPALKPAPYKPRKQAAVTRLKTWKTAAALALIIRHPALSENWYARNCHRQWPMRINRLAIRQGGKPLLDAWLGAINTTPLIFLRLKKYRKEAISLDWSNTLGQKFQLQKIPGKSIKTNDNSILINAAGHGGVNYVRHLLDLGISPDSGNRFRSALAVAAGYGNTGIVRLMLSRGADINRFSPLLRAAANGKLGTTRLLLQKGAHNHLDCSQVDYGYGNKKSCNGSVYGQILQLNDNRGVYNRLHDDFYRNKTAIIKLLHRYFVSAQPGDT